MPEFHDPDFVTIPSAQYEALMAAAKAFLSSRIRSAKIDAALAALRAAGIQIEGE